ncbi:MAG: hypothetical protein JW982_06990 [Spirochaetes bacterium]|nr:hypothetical protein [Spirochaetota bacterium]
MDLNDNKEQSLLSSKYLEKSLLEYVKELQRQNIGAKKKNFLNKGFFYLFCRNRFITGYSLSNTMKKETFVKASKNRESRIKLIKAWSAKFSRYAKGSQKALQEIEKSENHIITYPTLGNQLAVADFIILTENLSDSELIALLRPPAEK